MAILVPIEDARRLEPDQSERIARNLAALDRLEALRHRLSREHPSTAAPHAATAVRQEHERDDPT